MQRLRTELLLRHEVTKSFYGWVSYTLARSERKRHEEPWEAMPEIYELNPAGTLPVYLEDSDTALSGIEAITEADIASTIFVPDRMPVKMPAAKTRLATDRALPAWATSRSRCDSSDLKFTAIAIAKPIMNSTAMVPRAKAIGMPEALSAASGLKCITGRCR